MIKHKFNKDEKEAYIQLWLGLLVCIGFALWVSFSDWTVNFFPPPIVPNTEVYGR